MKPDELTDLPVVVSGSQAYGASKHRKRLRKFFYKNKVRGMSEWLDDGGQSLDKDTLYLSTMSPDEIRPCCREDTYHLIEWKDLPEEFHG